MRASRAWVPPAIDERIAGDLQRYRAMSSDELAATLHDTIEAHERLMDRESISLYAGTNVMNPSAAAVLASTLGVRPSLGYPYDKYETGMAHAEQVEIIAAGVLTDVFDCRHVELRVASGALANLYAYMATCQPGDRVLVFPASAAGHVTHHADGAAGLYGLRVADMPYDKARMQIDLDGLRDAARQLRPRLLIVGGSMNLFPYDVAAVADIARDVGAFVLYDAAHMAGLIAGGEWQHPLREGAHLMTCSTYKSFGGPPQGLVLTDDDDLAERLDRIAYPGLTANFDLSKTAALALAALDLREHGRAYARACVENAQALGAALAGHGVPVHEVAGRGHTQSHHLALPAATLGGGMTAARTLERANILVSGIGLPLADVPGDAFNAVRLGTQEVTRWGMTPDTMEAIAELTAAVLVGGEDPTVVRRRTVELRAAYQTVSFVRSPAVLETAAP